jgi:putative solute:sodium symporter small subunit
MKNNTYWKKNVQYISILLSLWFLVSFGCGILFVEQLNTIQIGGFKLGFWFAQQGSIFGFVAIIFTYIYLMNRLDNKLNNDN